MSNKIRVIVDLTILSALIAIYYPGATGIAVHEWLALGVGVPVVVHLVVNWDWVVFMTMITWRRRRDESRVDYIVDALLYVALITAGVSGLMISQVLSQAVGWTLAVDPLWRPVHSVSADIATAFMIVHVTLHWKWFVRVGREHTGGVRVDQT